MAPTDTATPPSSQSSTSGPDTSTLTSTPSAPQSAPSDLPSGTLGGDTQNTGERITIGLFIAVPFVALLAAIPVAWMGGMLSWLDVTLAVVMYLIAGHGITVGFHRHFTHRAFKANRPTKIAMAISGSMAIEGPVIRWVADHRRHHKYADKEGDPHSPWRYGNNVPALIKGMFFAHMGWMFDVEQTDQRKFAPDLLKDKDIRLVSRLFPLWVAISLLLPPIVGGLATWSWQGALTAFFWATLVRVGLLHHVTWSINSICHAIGERPFESRDKSGNVWWLAVLSMGESWHNLHHADPTSARHGVLKGQIDSSARVIKILERFGWVWDARWPSAERIEGKRVDDYGGEKTLVAP
ncbi:acyl-CoA desaturase [Actinobacteria bacterium YIM 96077]|uniref:Acyl-CoA desaturase n=1 Tax=Phytoactinopolyspora halophila TaxID=1981511 RepID=A0A329QLN7_9ACTN|nr:acyl-CoA desaturase [Phytoactinopolyspora halophila]AYY14455.1 acyl-CoA desaturase [Actinobacteria bacterium YIM 96077]RAW11448.1 acyl-CoA desaturase [Phytoactinopolyspora halophila]